MVYFFLIFPVHSHTQPKFNPNGRWCRRQAAQSSMTTHWNSGATTTHSYAATTSRSAAALTTSPQLPNDHHNVETCCRAARRPASHQTLWDNFQLTHNKHKVTTILVALKRITVTCWAQLPARSTDKIEVCVCLNC